MKKILILVLAILLLTGCSVQNSNKETEKSLNDQEENVVLNDKTDEKEKEQEKTSKLSEKTNNKKNNNKTSNEKKTANKKTTNTTQTTETKKTDKPSKQGDEEKNKKTPVEKLPQKNDNKEEKHKHMFTVNGGWYKTENEAYKKFKSISDSWDKKYENGEIDWDEYSSKCPTGYEVYRCSCGMQGLNIFYN